MITVNTEKDNWIVEFEKIMQEEYDFWKFEQIANEFNFHLDYEDRVKIFQTEKFYSWYYNYNDFRLLQQKIFQEEKLWLPNFLTQYKQYDEFLQGFATCIAYILTDASEVEEFCYLLTQLQYRPKSGPWGVIEQLFPKLTKPACKQLLELTNWEHRMRSEKLRERIKGKLDSFHAIRRI